MTNRHCLTIMEVQPPPKRPGQTKGAEKLREERSAERGATVREWLIRIREEKEMTQGSVANAAGIAQPSYFEIEKGISNPRPETAKKIAAVLGFPWTRFYEDGETEEGGGTAE